MDFNDRKIFDSKYAQKYFSSFFNNHIIKVGNVSENCVFTMLKNNTKDKVQGNTNEITQSNFFPSDN